MKVKKKYTPKKLTSLYQFVPPQIAHLKNQTKIKYQGQNLKTAYVIDFIHRLMWKYYYKKKNEYNLSSIILKENYGKLYNYYVEYAVDQGLIRMIRNFNIGTNSRVYELSEDILNNDGTTRWHNTDAILLKKYNKQVEFYILNSNGYIDPDIQQKLIDDLFVVDINEELATEFLNMIYTSVPSYEKNMLVTKNIKAKNMYYHFDSYGRMHTNFTILKSHIRKNYLSIEGDKLIELDIDNSQPRFLAKIITDTPNNIVSEDDFRLFKVLTESGKLYEYFIQQTDLRTKDEVKKMVYKVFFGNNQSNKSNNTFKRIFPSIFKFIRDYKASKGSYKILSHELQRSESNLIYNKIIREVVTKHPEIRFVTIHDSIMFQEKYKNIVEPIFNQKLIEEFK